MGKSQGFVLPFTGRVGRTTTGYRAGRYITRVIPDVKPSGDPTFDQLLQRAKFGKLGAVLSPINVALRFGLNHLDPTFAYQQGMKLNFDAVSGNDPRSITINFTNLIVSKGNLKGADFAAPSFEETNTVEVNFVGHASTEEQDANDKVYLLVYSDDLNAAILSEPVLRSATKVTVSTPLGWNGSRVYVYGFTFRNKRNVGTSVYVGSGTIN
jgi:hypothetical protein